MTRAIAPLALALITLGSAASAQVTYYGYGGIQTINGQSPNAAGDMTMSIPTPATSVPPAEAIGGAVGTQTSVYALANHTHPRMSRSQTVVTDASGNFSYTWTNAMSAVPTVSITWVNKGSQPVSCELTADPTTTTVQGRCKTTAPPVVTLSALTAAALVGLTINPWTASPAGISVHIVAFPPAT